MRRRLIRSFAGLASLATAAAFTGAAVLAPPASAMSLTPPPGAPVTAGAAALPTWQINGVVWDQVIVGTTVYVTGNFTKARPSGAWEGHPLEIPQAHLMAYDIRTGERIASFDHQLNAQGTSLAASPDGSRVYVGGDFTTVDGQQRGHAAAFDTATGALLDFNPLIDGQVKTLAVVGDTVYAGGSFEGAYGVRRARLAAFDATSGQIRPWAPYAVGGYVHDMVLAPAGDKLVVAGAFTGISDASGATTPAYGTTALDLTTGAVLPWAMNQRIGGRTSGSWAITNLSTNGKYVFGGGYNYGASLKFEGTFAADPADGRLVFANDCLGDTYDTFPYADVFYAAGHPHDCSVIGAYPDSGKNWEHAVAFTTEPTGRNLKTDAYGVSYTDVPASTLLHFHPDLGIGVATGQYQASWTVEGTPEYIAYAGEFPTVNGTPQQGLTRFALTPGAATAPPQFESRAPYRTIVAPTATLRTDGAVSVSFQVAWDPDTPTLTHELVRDKGTAAEKVVATGAYDTNFWQLADRQLVDAQPTAGAHTYTVRVSDGTGNVINSGTSNSVTVVNSLALGAYGEAVMADAPAHYWRLNETSGSALDKAGTLTGTYSSGTVRGVTGALVGDTNKATRFDGTRNGNVVTAKETVSGEMTLEAWTRSTSTSGGRFLTLAPSSGSTLTTDRHIYLTPDGRAGVRSGGPSVPVVESTARYNDGRWHHVVATIAAGGVTLYVDGQQVARNAAIGVTPGVTGAWYIGGDRYGSSGSYSWALKGDTDEAAVYRTALTAAQVLRHYQVGMGQAAR